MTPTDIRREAFEKALDEMEGAIVRTRYAYDEGEGATDARAAVVALYREALEDARRLDWLLTEIADEYGEGTTPRHDCGFRRGEGTSCLFHERFAEWSESRAIDAATDAP